MPADQEAKTVPLAQVTARCKWCGWTGTADTLFRLPHHLVEIGGDENDAKVVGQWDAVMVYCPAEHCGARLRDIELTLPQDLPDGRYHLDFREGL